MKQQYKVGQVLFVVSSTKTMIIPVQVVEELTKRTLNGAEVSYIVKVGQNQEEKVDINKIDGEIYTSAAQVKKALIERSSSAIANLVINAEKKASEWYQGGFEGTSIESGLISDIKKKDDKPRDQMGKFVTAEQEPVEQNKPGVQVEMPDGTVANVKMPKELEG